jgi:CBS domain-containing protein
MHIRDTKLLSAQTIPSTMTAIDVAKRMRDDKLRQLYVLDEHEFPVGVISLTDINSRIVAAGRNPDGLHARDIMTTPLHMVEIDNDVGKAYNEMLAHDTLAIPVTDNGLLVGVLSMSEALRALVDEKRHPR